MLSKPVCLKCWDYYLHSKRYPLVTKEDERVFHFRWSQGYVLCNAGFIENPYFSPTKDIMINNSAPERCPYYLEHIVNETK
jgi:hypothetical protein